MAAIIGIDLGTSNARAAVVRNGRPVMIPTSEGATMTPSVVSAWGLPPDPGPRVGKRPHPLSPWTAMNTKRRLGEEKNTGDSGNYPSHPQDLAVELLRKLKTDAEKFLGQQVTEAVLTVPVRFTYFQRLALMDAAKAAGLKVRRMLSDSTAVALGYSQGREEAMRILSVDLGGGYCDVSLVDVDKGVVDTLAVAGSRRVGGMDFDRRLAEHLAERHKQRTGRNLHLGSNTGDHLICAAERAKIFLSFEESTRVRLSGTYYGSKEACNLEDTITRQEFLEWTQDLVDAAMYPVRQVLTDSGLRAAELDQVIFTGGMSRMPAMQAALRRITGKTPAANVDSLEYAAMGAAIFGAGLNNEIDGFILLDVLPGTVGIAQPDGSVLQLLERNTTLPVQKKAEIAAEVKNGAAELRLVQGENPQADKNLNLGQLRLEGLSAGAGGKVSLQLTVDGELTGIIRLSARETGSGRSASAVFTDWHYRPSLHEEESIIGGASALPPKKPLTEKEAAYRDGRIDTIEKLLPVYDDLARALEQPTEDAAYKKGVEMTMNKLCNAMQSLGVEIFGEVGERFDPNFHNALAHNADTRYGVSVITRVYQKGFRLDDRIIRFASVHVAN